MKESKRTKWVAPLEVREIELLFLPSLYRGCVLAKAFGNVSN